MTPRVAIVGSGLGVFVAYATLRHGGLDRETSPRSATRPTPASVWRPRAARSGSATCAPRATATATSDLVPGAGGAGAARKRDLVPLLQTVCNRYRPTVAEFLRHVDELRTRSGWDESFHPCRIGRVQAVEGGFELDGDGHLRHVLLAPGHPGLALPTELAADLAPSMPTRGTTTPRGSPSSAPAWLRRPSG